MDFRWEKWDDVKAIMHPIWEAHNQEIASAGDKKLYAPDFDKLDELALQGKDHWFIARIGEKIVGYVFAIVDTHLHRKNTLSAFYDVYWLDPDHRTGWNGYFLLKAAQESLWLRGVRKQYAGTKFWKDAGHLFERLGWVETERLYTISLDN